MRDGKVVASDAAAGFDRDKLVATMGGADRHARAAETEAARARGGTPVRVRARRSAARRGPSSCAARDHRPRIAAGTSCSVQTDRPRGAPRIEVRMPIVSSAERPKETESAVALGRMRRRHRMPLDRGAAPRSQKSSSHGAKPAQAE